MESASCSSSASHSSDSDGSGLTASTLQPSHPLLDELKGVLNRLKLSQQPVKDGQEHLVPLCETVEAILRKGLKQPNSWFGFNKQDYWSWVEPLQDYYFNEKQNPLLRQVVDAVSSSTKCHGVVGKGRCFLRIALCQKIISVPIEHLVKNNKLTQYWYTSDSIIRSIPLRAILMRLLFEVTELNFELSVDNSSFLNETWVVPDYQIVRLAPIKTLDIKVSYVEDRAVIVEVEADCLAARAGVEVGDVLDELCGEPVHDTAHGKLKQILLANSVDFTDLVIVKKHLPDGSPFFPIVRRQLISDYRASQSTEELSMPSRKPSISVQSTGSSTEYTIVYLGQEEADVVQPADIGKTVDTVISKVLNSTCKPQEVVLCVNQSEILLMSAGKKELLFELGYDVVCGCGRGTAHKTCFSLLTTLKCSSKSSSVAHVLETPSSELAQAICAHIAQGFNRSVWLRDKKS